MRFPAINGAASEFMRRLFFLVVLFGAVIVAIALLALGAFPPDPRPKQIEKVIPNDKFQKTG